MVFTPNKNLEQPARGSNVGVWDTPVNSNTGIIDNSFGGVATVPLVNTPVTLSPAQYQCVFLTFTGAISANVPITLPAVGSFYTVINQTTNSSAFIVTMLTTAAGSQTIGLPPGAVTEIFTDGANVKFRSLPHVGSYWDYAGSSVPAWISACTVPPWLNCDGTAFSSATYPALAALLGGVSTPDHRGRYRFPLNQGTGRITSGSSTGGIDGNTIFASGGSQVSTLSSQNIPPVPITDPTHTHNVTAGFTGVGGGGALAAGGTAVQNVNILSAASATGISAGSTSPTNFSNLPPSFAHGLTFIRAA